jgi:hypothetical protein
MLSGAVWRYGWKPLSCVAEEKHEAMVKLVDEDTVGCCCLEL